jgi:hypothetical protein
VTDTPLGPSVPLGVVRNDYTNAADPTSPVTTRAYTFGHDGLLHATAGYDQHPSAAWDASRWPPA